MGVLASLFSSLVSFATSSLKPLLLDLSSLAMDFLHRLLGSRVQEGTKPVLLYQLPVFQRRDGATIKLGYLVKKTEGGGNMSFVVRRILCRADPSLAVRLVLGLVTDSGVSGEEECWVGEVSCVRGRQAVLGVARDGMANIARTIGQYPGQVQRQVRRHQVAATLRREVQRFLGGFSHTHSLSLGSVDWRLDPGILGLERETDFSLDYRIERFVDQASHLDLLMGEGWDFRSVSGSDGFRIILTLELFVDLNQEMRVSLHGTQCPGVEGLEGAFSPRAACLASTARMAQPSHPTVTVQEADSAGLTLAWDEYQPVSRDCSPRRHIPSATVSMEDLLFTSSFPPDTSTALHGLDRLLSAIPSSQLVYNTSPIQDLSESRTGLSAKCLSSSLGSLAAGPNTSTPADELEGNSSQRSGQSRHSSPALQDDTADNRLGLEGGCREGEDELARKRLSGHFNMTDLIPGEELELQAGGRREVVKEREVVMGEREKVVGEEQESSGRSVVVEEERFNGIDGHGEREAVVSSRDDEEVEKTEVAGDCVKHQKSSIEPMETGPETEIGHEHIGEDWRSNIAMTLVHSESMGKEVADEKVLKISENMVYESDNILEHENMNAVEVAEPWGLLTPESKTPEGFEFVQHLDSVVDEHDRFEALTPTPALEALDFSPSSTGASLSEVAAYLQNQTDPLALEDSSELDTSCASSLSVASRASDLSSLSGVRVRGLFHGTALTSAGSGTVCPFPDDWQHHTIPEVIENDEDID